MNCPKCKNPVSFQSNLCEWCGNKINVNNSTYEPSDVKIHITISFEGIWLIGDTKVKIFADDILVGTGSLKNGFHIEFTLSKTQPILLVKHGWRSKKIEIPKLELGSNYEIFISFDRWLKGNFNSKPSNIIKNK
jgi:hypothetical protein